MTLSINNMRRRLGYGAVGMIFGVSGASLTLATLMIAFEVEVPKLPKQINKTQAGIKFDKNNLAEPTIEDFENILSFLNIGGALSGGIIGGLLGNRPVFSVFRLLGVAGVGSVAGSGFTIVSVLIASHIADYIRNSQ